MLIDIFRLHGAPPYRAVLVHGGPGAAGELEPVAHALSTRMGVLEPFQTARTIAGQLAELKTLIRREGAPPVVVVGHSWGAWLALLLAARAPELVEKIILVGCGPLEESWAADITRTRFDRLDADAREEVDGILSSLGARAPTPREFARLGELMACADAYDLSDDDPPGIEYDPALFREVWGEAEAFRRSGRLIAAAREISCPVVAIHGDHDPHPADGVRIPLERILPDFRFLLLERCGHAPWRERRARDPFYRLLERELA